MTHEEWLESTLWTDWNTENAWIAAQQAERERIKNILYEEYAQINVNLPRIMEKIDVSE